MAALNSWRERAACAGVDTEAFFNGSTAAAKRICARCPVQQECLAYALKTRETEGVWGGHSEAERERLLQAAVPTQDDVTLDPITYTTRARSTGATCAAGRTPTGWGVACETHDTRAIAPSRTAAENAVSRPQEWCPACQRIEAGVEPKVDAWQESSRKQ